MIRQGLAMARDARCRTAEPPAAGLPCPISAEVHTQMSRNRDKAEQKPDLLSVLSLCCGDGAPLLSSLPFLRFLHSPCTSRAGTCAHGPSRRLAAAFAPPAVGGPSNRRPQFPVRRPSASSFPASRLPSPWSSTTSRPRRLRCKRRRTRPSPPSAAPRPRVSLRRPRTRRWQVRLKFLALPCLLCLLLRFCSLPLRAVAPVLRVCVWLGVCA